MRVGIEGYVIEEDARRMPRHGQPEQGHDRWSDVYRLRSVRASQPPLIARVHMGAPHRLAHDVAHVIGDDGRGVRHLLDPARARNKASTIELRVAAGVAPRLLYTGPHAAALFVRKEGHLDDVVGRAAHAARCHMPVIAHNEKGRLVVPESLNQLVDDVARLGDRPLIRVATP